MIPNYQFCYFITIYIYNSIAIQITLAYKWIGYVIISSYK